jgi:PKD repeat protein
VSQNAPVWRVRRALLLALVFSFATISSAIAQQRQVLNGHVPQFIKNLNLQPVARLTATNTLHLAIGLPFRNQTALGQLLQQIYDPASPQYRHYLTSEQFTERFGPTVADYQAVINFAQASGLTVTGEHANRALLDVVGTAANIEKAFSVTLLVYPHPTENRNFYAPNVDPSVALAVPLLHISGLDNYELPHPNSHVMPLAGTEGGIYLGNDFRAAYVPGVSLKGTGQSVALLEYDGYYAVDITNYLHLAGVPSMTLTNILINGGPITPGGGDGEVSLDIEMAIAMAPNLSKILVYEGTNGVTPWATILTQIADDNLARQISCSWSGGGPDPSSEQALVKMAMQGQSFFNAVGDNDAFTGAIGFPSDSTNVTECGGTTLSTTGPGGSYVSEIVWNWGTPNSSGGDWGSSGGVSTYYSIPPWQQGVATTTNRGSSTMRNVPDVALTANNVYVTYNNGGNGSFGGTSCAAPLWAAFIALVNQQAATNGAAPVGFLNPALYAIGNGPNYAYCFHDITVGGNEWSPGSLTKFSAVPGYDLCTGWGTPNGANLIYALLSLASGSPYIIGAGSVVSGGNSSGVIGYDDCVLLSLPVVNIGQGTATVVSATLTTSTPGVTITQPNSAYANLASGAVTTNSTPFQISTSPSFVCGTPIPLSLVLSYTGGSVTNTITMPTCQCPTIQVNGGLSGASPKQSGAMFPNGTGSSCSAAKSCPGMYNAGTVAYNAYSFTNSSSSAVCVSVTVSTTCGTNAYSSIFSEAYLGNYNPINLCAANYLGDMGGIDGEYTGPGAFVYSFTVPANTNFTVVVNGMANGYYCSGYSVTVAGLLCPFDGGGSCAGISASFTETPTNGAAPLAVTFTDTSTGAITNRFWNFGDGATTNTTTNTLLHVYNAAGTDTVTLIVSGPLGASTNTQPNLIVVVPPPQVVVSPASITYGTLIIGQTNTQNFAVINTGGATLNGTAAMQTGGSPFAVSGGSPYTVAPGHTGTVSVAFAPSVAGTFTNAAVFTSNGGASTNQITGTALTPPQLMVSPPSQNFGTIATGSTSQMTFVVANTGGAPLSGTATITATPFGIVSGASYNLAGFGSTNVVISFTPPTVNSFTGNVIFASTGGVSTNLVTGSGAVVPAASFTALPTNGAAPLAVSFTDTSTGTIASRFWNFGDSTSTNVTTNTVVHSYSTGTYSVTLIVTGPLGTSTNMHANLIVVVPPAQLVVGPTSVSYGAVIIGQTNTQTFAVINTGGVTLNGTAAMQTGGSPFAISGGSPYNVAPGQTGTVSVAFAPAAPSSPATAGRPPTRSRARA